MATTPPSYSPGRPPSEKDLLLLLNGDPQPLGVLTSTGTTAPVNNITTATPFNTGGLNAVGGRGLIGSLAGRVLLISANAAGVFLTSNSWLISVPTVTTVALRSVIPPLAATFPGNLMNIDETKILIMSSIDGWIQWLSNSGTASLIVAELV